MRTLLALLLTLVPLHHTADRSAENVAKLIAVWSEVKYLDPHLMTRDIDWDGAFVRAVPKVRAAKTDAELARAIGSMLAELNDPATVVVERAETPKKEVPLHRTEGDVLILNLAPFAEGGGSVFQAGSAIATALRGASKVVVDLRGSNSAVEATGYVLGSLGLNRGVAEVPPSRAVFHSGYAPQEGASSGGYYSALQLIASPAIQRPSWLDFPPPARVVLLTNGKRLPPAAAALWWSGDAAIVSEAPLTDDALADTRAIPIAGDWVAEVRIFEPAVTGLAADAVVAGSDAAMAKAIELARATTPLPKRPPMQATTVTPRLAAEKPYAEMTSPELPYRLLALARFWSIIDRFYPYKHLITDWDAALRTMIPVFENAEGGEAYAAAVMEAVALVEDGHSGANGHPAQMKVLGGTHVPAVQIRVVEGEFVVTHALSDALKAGDVVVAVDGVPLRERVQRLRKYITASTEVARTHRILNSALRGAKDSEAVLTVRNADGSTREVRIKRDQTSVPQPKKSGPAYRVLDGNIGYADLTRLTVGEVDAMFEAFQNTKAILFDMRGYPRGTAWAIAPRINTKGAKYAASFRRPEVSPMTGGGVVGAFAFDQPIPELPKGESLYRNPTAMLIDDRAISQSEHSGLFYEAANDTKFIGTPTAGANGDVTSFPLPGGMRVAFTGHDVRHADGRQLQRVGLQPHIKVEPTIRGVREGKDEVLERAIAWANQAAATQ